MKINTSKTTDMVIVKNIKLANVRVERTKLHSQNIVVMSYLGENAGHAEFRL